MAIKHLYVCDLCDNTIERNEGYRLYYTSSSDHTFEFRSLGDTQSSEDIYCRECIRGFSFAIDSLKRKENGYLD